MGVLDFFRRENRNTILSLEAFLSNLEITKDMALEIPTFSGGIDLIADIVASTPIKLYEDESYKAKEVTDDNRLRLLNEETGDILTSNDFWKAIVKDYYTGKGGYAYINKIGNEIKSIHYVDEESVSVTESTDKIFKYGEIYVEGTRYNEFDFIKILRNTKNGLSGKSIIEEKQKMLAVGYYSLNLESNNFKRGGIKKGFLTMERNIGEEAIGELKTAFNKLYNEDTDTFVVLNKGVAFKENSATQAEMQLTQSKNSNVSEFSKLFHISPDVISGKSSDTKALAKLAAIPLMKTIQSALNASLLLEKEKGKYYFAFDTKELLKGEMAERFSAYKTALEANFMQIDEVRYLEDLEALGLNWIKLGLQDVLYNPETKLIYTPNTNKTSSMTESEIGGSNEEDEDELKEDPNDEEGREWQDQGRKSNGQFAPGRKKGSKSAKILTSGARNDIVKSGALEPDSKKASEHAKKYYSSVRKMSNDCKMIAEKNNINLKMVESAKEHLFMKKHDLGGIEKEHFVPDYEIAQSWQRLMDAKMETKPHDIVLIQHENMEADLMSRGLTQQEAHDETNKIYNYTKALKERK